MQPHDKRPDPLSLIIWVLWRLIMVPVLYSFKHFRVMLAGAAIYAGALMCLSMRPESHRHSVPHVTSTFQEASIRSYGTKADLLDK